MQVWDDQAKNLTFRAVVDAFNRKFPQNMELGTIRMATEPEACALYTMRAVQEEEGVLRLRRVSCFPGP